MEEKRGRTRATNELSAEHWSLHRAGREQAALLSRKTSILTSGSSYKNRFDKTVDAHLASMTRSLPKQIPWNEVMDCNVRTLSSPTGCAKTLRGTATESSGVTFW